MTSLFELTRIGPDVSVAQEHFRLPASRNLALRWKPGPINLPGLRYYHAAFPILLGLRRTRARPDFGTIPSIVRPK